MGALVSVIGSVVLTYFIIIKLLKVGSSATQLGPLGPFEKAGPFGLVLVVFVAFIIWFGIFSIILPVSFVVLE